MEVLSHFFSAGKIIFVNILIAQTKFFKNALLPASNRRLSWGTPKSNNILDQTYDSFTWSWGTNRLSFGLLIRLGNRIMDEEWFNRFTAKCHFPLVGYFSKLGQILHETVFHSCYFVELNNVQGIWALQLFDSCWQSMF